MLYNYKIYYSYRDKERFLNKRTLEDKEIKNTFSNYSKIFFKFINFTYNLHIIYINY